MIDQGLGNRQWPNYSIVHTLPLRMIIEIWNVERNEMPRKERERKKGIWMIALFSLIWVIKDKKKRSYSYTYSLLSPWHYALRNKFGFYCRVLLPVACHLWLWLMTCFASCVEIFGESSWLPNFHQYIDQTGKEIKAP